MRIQIRTVNKPLALFSYSSLTDIVLLLLIFFLLTSSFIATSGLRVNLPEASATRPPETNQVTVTVRSSGEIFVGDRSVAAGELASALAEVLNDPANQIVVLSSDKDVPLERAVFVLDAARQQGASRFFIATRQEAMK